LAGLRYSTVIKEIEMAQCQQEKQRIRGRSSRIKQFKGPFTIEKCFLEVRSHSDVCCGTLDYKIIKMKGLFSVMY